MSEIKAYLVRVKRNYETGEVISREIIGESDYDPTNEFVKILLEKWNKDHPEDSNEL